MVSEYRPSCAFMLLSSRSAGEAARRYHGGRARTTPPGSSWSTLTSGTASGSLGIAEPRGGFHWMSQDERSHERNSAHLLPKPLLRGWSHAVAAIAALVTTIALVLLSRDDGARA